MTPTVKSGIAPATFAMTDRESLDVRFGSKAALATPKSDFSFTSQSGLISDHSPRA